MFIFVPRAPPYGSRPLHQVPQATRRGSSGTGSARLSTRSLTDSADSRTPPRCSTPGSQRWIAARRLLPDVRRQLESVYHFPHEDFVVLRYAPEDFLVRFRSQAAMLDVLHASTPTNTPFSLVWRRWRRETMASPGSFRFKVLLESLLIFGRLQSQNGSSATPVLRSRRGRLLRAVRSSSLPPGACTLASSPRK